MGLIPKSLKILTSDLQRLPGIGPKSARRLAYYLFALPEDRLHFLSKTIRDLKESVTVCQFCRILSDTNPCDICGDYQRLQRQLCIVEDHMDVYSIERSGGFKGLYFVLGGVLSPSRGVGPENIALDELGKRIKQLIDAKSQDKTPVELILALSPNTEGQTTALYIKEVFRTVYTEQELAITRVAIGISVGTDLDYVDSFTLQEALKGRNRV